MTSNVYQVESLAQVAQEMGRHRHLRQLSDALYRTVDSAIELLAQMNLEREAWIVKCLGMDRLFLTPHENRIWQLEREYMRQCQTILFRRAYREYAPADYIMRWDVPPNEVTFKENKIPPLMRVSWIAVKANADRVMVKAALRNVQYVLELRDMRGLEGFPPVMDLFSYINTYTQQSAA